MFQFISLYILLILSTAIATRINLIQDGTFEMTNNQTYINPYWAQNYYIDCPNDNHQIFNKIDQNWLIKYNSCTCNSTKMLAVYQKINGISNITVNLEFDLKIIYHKFNDLQHSNYLNVFSGFNQKIFTEYDANYYQNWKKIIIPYISLPWIYNYVYFVYYGGIHNDLIRQNNITYLIDNVGIWIGDDNNSDMTSDTVMDTYIDTFTDSGLSVWKIIIIVIIILIFLIVMVRVIMRMISKTRSYNKNMDVEYNMLEFQDE